MLHVYGIPNCNTVKKALDYLRWKNLPFMFHDVKKEGVTLHQLHTWADVLGMENLLNRKGTTWRALTESEKMQADTLAGALSLMRQKTSIIRRPIVEWPDGRLTVGFHETDFPS